MGFLAIWIYDGVCAFWGWELKDSQNISEDD